MVATVIRYRMMYLLPQHNDAMQKNTVMAMREWFESRGLQAGDTGCSAGEYRSGRVSEVQKMTLRIPELMKNTLTIN